MKLLKTGVHTYASRRRTTFLLVPKNFDGRIARKSREKLDTLSLKSQNLPTTSPLYHFTFSSPFSIVGDDTIEYFVLSNLRIPKMTSMSPSFGFSTFGTTLAVHFHHFSIHATCITCIHVIGDFCHIKICFPAVSENV